MLATSLTPRNKRCRSLLAAFALGLSATLASSANAEVLSTNFVGGVPGDQPSAESLNGLADFTTFGGPNLANDLLGGTPNVGEVLFIRRPAFYVGGNRAYGFAGEGRSDITFAPGIVREVSLEVRGSSQGDSIGESVGSLAANTVLDDSDVTVLIYSDLGLQLTISDVSNTEFQNISLDITNPAFDGDSITRISLINQGPANSLADLGFLEVTAVPEPGSIALLAGASVLVMRRRRRD